MAGSSIEDPDKIVLLPDNEAEEGLVLAGKLPAEALHHDTARAERAQVEQMSHPQAAAASAPGGGAKQSQSHDEAGNEGHALPPPRAAAGGPEEPGGAKQPHRSPGASGGADPQPPHLPQPPLGSAVRSVRETVRGLFERVEKAVGILPAEGHAHEAAAAHTAVTVSPPPGAPHLPPHDPAAAARERAQDAAAAALQHLPHHPMWPVGPGAPSDSTAAEEAALVRELPSLEAIRDSARDYVDTLRHSVREPEEAAAELAGRMVGKTSYGHPHPHHTPNEPPSSPTSGPKQQQHTRSFSWGSILGGGGGGGAGSGSAAGGSPLRESGRGFFGSPRQERGGSPNSGIRHAVAHTPEAASELAGRIFGKGNYLHPQPQPQPHPPPAAPLPVVVLRHTTAPAGPQAAAAPAAPVLPPSSVVRGSGGGMRAGGSGGLFLGM
ncbi:hypothetical protein GPECTOR_1g811 [Gonium pectorale]|uniref:Uncharacterized protein n=1 Tax=Gonium pectorale TaxID=33097 RepID=A0A150H5J7_GONPE|nr:hypothetical protein GPECTOR_1g811 [Gonium pectorale]|eukprot:KXZ56900.1 hypothetical protein GPECTOR_1g811 [Gonium pectorale]